MNEEAGGVAAIELGEKMVIARERYSGTLARISLGDRLLLSRLQSVVENEFLFLVEAARDILLHT